MFQTSQSYEQTAGHTLQGKAPRTRPTRPGAEPPGPRSATPLPQRSPRTTRAGGTSSLRRGLPAARHRPLPCARRQALPEAPRRPLPAAPRMPPVPPARLSPAPCSPPGPLRPRGRPAHPPAPHRPWQCHIEPVRRETPSSPPRHFTPLGPLAQPGPCLLGSFQPGGSGAAPAGSAARPGPTRPHGDRGARGSPHPGGLHSPAAPALRLPGLPAGRHLYPSHSLAARELGPPHSRSPRRDSASRSATAPAARPRPCRRSSAARAAGRGSGVRYWFLCREYLC